MNVRQKLLSRLVIPAHPLALTAERKLDERRQRRAALAAEYLGKVALGEARLEVEAVQRAVLVEDELPDPPPKLLLHPHRGSRVAGLP